MQRIFKATKHSWDGLKALWFEKAFRQEIYLCIILTPFIFLLPISGEIKLLLFLLLLLLLVIEALNSAIEAVVDRISLERHPHSKLAKDAGSAAVFLVLAMNAVAWVYALFQL
jgi:diacylglycerol kinase (ATP)